MSVYGDFLGAWSELFKKYSIYTCSPIVTAGYNVKFEKNVRGVLLTSTRNRLQYRMGLTTDECDHTLYTQAEIDLTGRLLKYKDKWYRAVAKGDWNEEGGFYITLMQKVVGNVTDETNVSEQVIAGEF